MNWLKKSHFFDSIGLNFKEDQVFFEVTREKKITRIIETGCTHFVDDLPEVLEMIPDGVKKILFSPNEKNKLLGDWITIKSWKELPAILT